MLGTVARATFPRGRYLVLGGPGGYVTVRPAAAPTPGTVDGSRVYDAWPASWSWPVLYTFRVRRGPGPSHDAIVAAVYRRFELA